MPEPTAPMTPADFMAATGVSRETLARLERHAALLAAWAARLNLVGRGTLADVWRRHMLDSAQLFPLMPPDARVVVDIGSGAGFPGLTLAAMGAPEVHLVESDGRKAVFLREAARAMGVAVTVHAARVESLPPFPADVITARAVAPPRTLLRAARGLIGPGTVCLFPLGQSWRTVAADLDGALSPERLDGVAVKLTGAADLWHGRAVRLPSRTDPRGVILRLDSARGD